MKQHASKITLLSTLALAITACAPMQKNETANSMPTATASKTEAAQVAPKAAIAAPTTAPVAVTIPASVAPKSTPAVYPADVVGGLERWHLTLPTSKAQQPFPADQIDQPELNTYSSEFFKLNDSKNGIVMTSLFGGATTSKGTAFARTELREYDEKGVKAAWDCKKAERSMTMRLRVLSAPPHKSEMSLGQIHDAKSDNLEVMFIGNNDKTTGRILAKMNGESKSKAVLLDENYKLGEMMIVKVSTKAGVITVDYLNEQTGVKASGGKPFTKVKGGCYFKAGNYHQACTKINMYGKVNPNCSKKSYAPEKFETDPKGTSVLELYGLALDK